MRRLSWAVLTVLFSASLALADTVYDVSGDVTLAGNVNCPTCRESIGFSFGIDYVPSPSGFGFTWYTPTVIDFSSTWSGQMGNAPGAPGVLDVPSYVPLFNAGGDEVDIDLPSSFSEPYSIYQPVPVLQGADLWGCMTSTCVNDFVDPELINGSHPLVGIYQPEDLSNVSVTLADPPAVHTPEPSTMAMLGLTGLLLGAMMVWKKRELARCPK